MRTLFSDDTILDINFMMTDALRAAAHRMCPNRSAVWSEMDSRDHEWKIVDGS